MLTKQIKEGDTIYEVEYFRQNYSISQLTVITAHSNYVVGMNEEGRKHPFYTAPQFELLFDGEVEAQNYIEDQIMQRKKDRLHILEGIKIAEQNIEKVIEWIKNSENTKVAKKALVKEFDFSAKQVNAIMKMNLSQLNVEKINKEHEELKKN